MNSSAYHIFETAIGYCAIAWNDDYAITGFRLPEASRKLTEDRIARQSNGTACEEPPAAIRNIIDRVCRHLDGDLQDFRDVAIDLDGAAPFAMRVYQAARAIPSGEVSTYGGIAKTIRRPAAARAVGQALGKNPIALIIPCHRILAAGGKIGGFSAYGGLSTKARMLDIEDAKI